MKKPRSKKYQPQPASRTGLDVLQRAQRIRDEAQPLTATELDKISISFHTAIDMMTAGLGQPEHFDTIVYALNIGRILAEHGIGTEYKAILDPAMAGMQRCRERYESTGKFGLDGECLTSIKNIAELHDEQCRIATSGELRAALEEMHRRVADGLFYEVG